MNHGTNIICQHRDANGNHYPNCPLPECVDGVLCCEVHLAKDRQPAVTYDAGFGGRLCRECAGNAVAANRCAVCPETEGTEEVTLVNKSKLRLCQRCSRIHSAMVLEGVDAALARAAEMAEARGAA